MKLKNPFFITYYAALDVRDVMDTVIAPIKGSTVGIYCSSYGTFFCNTLLHLPGIISILVLDGAIAATRWSLVNSARTRSMVTLNSIEICIKNSLNCSKYLGEMGHIPQMVNDAGSRYSYRSVELDSLPIWSKR